MSSDSNSDDDFQIQQFLEAADPTLLNNSMFHPNNETNSEQVQTAAKSKTDIVECTKKDLPKSQRHLEEQENTGTDFNLPESMQKYMAKKLSEILKQHYEFYDATTTDNSKILKSKYKNRVKLLKGDKCNVNSYEDFEYETKGPDKKPDIKRRIVDKQIEQDITEEDKLKMVAIDANMILSGSEVSKWAKKKDRKDKIFHYRLASSGVAHAIEDPTEFTETRCKNKWNESKIKKFKNDIV